MAATDVITMPGEAGANPKVGGKGIKATTHDGTPGELKADAKSPLDRKAAPGPEGPFEAAEAGSAGTYPACPNCGKKGLRGWVHRQKHKLADRKAARDKKKAEKAEAKERKAATDRMLKAFDDETREAANRSPTLQKQLAELERDKWRVVHGTPGAGSTCNRDQKVISIESPEQRGACHGCRCARGRSRQICARARNLTPRGHQQEGTTSDQKVSQNMRDEGDAQYNAAKVRDEVKGNGGKDTGIPGQHELEYQDTYERHKRGGLTEDQAKAGNG
ncbi:MAG: hypothetical protein QM784_31835 [Polyangiaceae bacterium]